MTKASAKSSFDPGVGNEAAVVNVLPGTEAVSAKSARETPIDSVAMASAPQNAMRATGLNDKTNHLSISLRTSLLAFPHLPRWCAG